MIALLFKQKDKQLFSTCTILRDYDWKEYSGSLRTSSDIFVEESQKLTTCENTGEKYLEY